MLPRVAIPQVTYRQSPFHFVVYDRNNPTNHFRFKQFFEPEYQYIICHVLCFDFRGQPVSKQDKRNMFGNDGSYQANIRSF